MTKVVFWGGPWNGQVREIPADLVRTGMLVMPEGRQPLWDERDHLYARRTEPVRYHSRLLSVPGLAKHRDAPDPWPVMVPADSTEAELRQMLAWESEAHPMVDGPRNPLSFDDVFAAVATSALSED